MTTVRCLYTELAIEIGCVEAILVHHIDYWMQNGNDKYRDTEGFMWFKTSRTGLIKNGGIPATETKIKRVIIKLENMGILHSKQPVGNKEKYYKLNYSHQLISSLYPLPLNAVSQGCKTTQPGVQNDPTTGVQNDPTRGSKRPNPIYNKNKHQYINSNKQKSPPSQEQKKNSFINKEEQHITNRSAASIQFQFHFATNKGKAMEILNSLSYDDRCYILSTLSREDRNQVLSYGIESAFDQVKAERENKDQKLFAFGNFTPKTHILTSACGRPETDQVNMWQESIKDLLNGPKDKRDNRFYLEGIFRKKLLGEDNFQQASVH